MEDTEHRHRGCESTKRLEPVKELKGQGNRDVSREKLFGDVSGMVLEREAPETRAARRMVREAHVVAARRYGCGFAFEPSSKIVFPPNSVS